MPHVTGLTFYLGKSPAAKHARGASNLMLEDYGLLCQSFRKSLLKSQAQFKATVNIPELPPVEAVWHGIGQTAGVCLWLREGRVGAASMFINGLERDKEVQEAMTFFKAHHLDLPTNFPDKISQKELPLLVTVHYNLRSFVDPVVPTAAEALANAFFTMFGTNDDEKKVPTDP